jgi:hypothetical protein
MGTLIPANLLTRDIDREASTLLSPDQMREYRAKTEQARYVWETRKANYKHLSGAPNVFGKHGWRDIEAKTAAYFLVFQTHLWAVLMSLRVGKDKAV